MNPETNDLQVFLRDNEMAISRLYRHFVKTFPEDAEFREKMSWQEISHGEEIDQLRELVADGELPFGKSTLRCWPALLISTP